MLTYVSGYFFISFKTSKFHCFHCRIFLSDIVLFHIFFNAPYFILYLRVQHVNHYYTTSECFISRKSRELFISNHLSDLKFFFNNFYFHPQSQCCETITPDPMRKIRLSVAPAKVLKLSLIAPRPHPWGS